MLLFRKATGSLLLSLDWRYGLAIDDIIVDRSLQRQ
jgi:hypothetical protein